MKLLVAGSREYTDYNRIKSLLDKIVSEYNIDTIISGTARGADRLGERYAREHNLNLEQYPADWDRYGKSAGYIRNKVMVEQADVLLALWKDRSPGTGHTIELAKKKGIQRFIVMIESK